MIRRRAAILVVVLLMLALASALMLPLGRIGLMRTMTSQRASLDIRHRLAADSVVALLPTLIADDRRIRDGLERGNWANMAFELGDVGVQVTIQDDSAKLPVALMARARADVWLEIAVGTYRNRLGLPQLALRPTSPAGIGCLDDLFDAATDDDLFGAQEPAMGWARVLTPLGQTVNLLRAEPITLAALLADLDPKSSGRVLQANRHFERNGVADLIATAGLTGPTASTIEQRLSTQTSRYSILIRSVIGTDSRRRYLICTADDPPQVLVDWEIAP